MLSLNSQHWQPLGPPNYYHQVGAPTWAPSQCPPLIRSTSQWTGRESSLTFCSFYGGCIPDPHIDHLLHAVLNLAFLRQLSTCPQWSILTQFACSSPQSSANKLILHPPIQGTVHFLHIALVCRLHSKLAVTFPIVTCTNAVIVFSIHAFEAII